MRNRKSFFVFVIVGALLVFLIVLRFTNSGGGSGVSTSVPCLVPNVPLLQHIHSHLKVSLDSKEVPIPASVGLTGGCERAVHTHDGTGELHVEAQDTREYALSDFFSVWGEPFDRPGYAREVTVDGAPTDAGGALILKDKQQIVVTYTKSVENP